MTTATMERVSNKSKTVLVADMKPIQKDQYGCLLGNIPSRINLAVDETPRTVEEIAKRAGHEGVDGKRVQYHFDVCQREKKHVGPFLVVSEDGKLYSVKPFVATK